MRYQKHKLQASLYLLEAQIQVFAEVEEYDAPWLKQVKKVYRDSAGRFATKDKDTENKENPLVKVGDSVRMQLSDLQADFGGLWEDNQETVQQIIKDIKRLEDRATDLPTEAIQEMNESFAVIANNVVNIGDRIAEAYGEAGLIASDTVDWIRAYNRDFYLSHVEPFLYENFPAPAFLPLIRLILEQKGAIEKPPDQKFADWLRDVPLAYITTGSIAIEFFIRYATGFGELKRGIGETLVSNLAAHFAEATVRNAFEADAMSEDTLVFATALPAVIGASIGHSKAFPESKTKGLASKIEKLSGGRVKFSLEEKFDEKWRDLTRHELRWLPKRPEGIGHHLDYPPSNPRDERKHISLDEIDELLSRNIPDLFENILHKKRNVPLNKQFARLKEKQLQEETDEDTKRVLEGSISAYMSAINHGEKFLEKAIPKFDTLIQQAPKRITKIMSREIEDWKKTLIGGRNRADLPSDTLEALKIVEKVEGQVFQRLKELG